MSDRTQLWSLSALECLALLDAREITPLDLIDAVEDRVSAVDGTLNALPTTCFDRARDHARRIMEAPPPSSRRGWLGGLPVAIKDLTDVAGVRTTYGSPLYANHIPDRSHPVVSRIEANGGIVIAKSNTPEFGSGGSTFNEVFGRTRNPWNTSLTPGDRLAVVLPHWPLDWSGSHTEPITQDRCAAPQPIAPSSACVRQQGVSPVALSPTQCRPTAFTARWRAPSRTWHCSSMP